jgi:hypothetical protein
MLKVAPWDYLSFAIEALQDGANFRDAAKAAGLPPWKLNLMLELGQEGHPTWYEFYEVAIRADFESQRRTIIKRRQRAENGDSETAMKNYSRYKDEDQFGRIYSEDRGAPVNAGGGGALPGGMTVQIAQFGPGSSGNGGPPEKNEALLPRDVTPALEPGEKELE